MGKVKVLFLKEQSSGIAFLSPIAKTNPNIAKEEKKGNKISGMTAHQTKRRRIKHLYRQEASKQKLVEEQIALALKDGDTDKVVQIYENRIKELQQVGERNTQLICDEASRAHALEELMKKIATEQITGQQFVGGQYEYTGTDNKTMTYSDTRVAYIAETIRAKWKGEFDKSHHMLGVMLTEDGTCYVTVSGYMGDKIPPLDIDLPGIELGKTVFVKDSRIGVASDSTDSVISIQIGTETVEIEEKDTHTKVGSCAAPKLWVYAVNHGHIPLAFSEYKLDTNKKQRESCGNCKELMSVLLKATQKMFKDIENDINASFEADAAAMTQRLAILDQLINSNGVDRLKWWNLLIKDIERLVQAFKEDGEYIIMKENLSKDKKRKILLDNIDLMIERFESIVVLMKDNLPLAIEKRHLRQEALTTIKEYYKEASVLMKSLVNRRVVFKTGENWVNYDVEVNLFYNFDRNGFITPLIKNIPRLT